MWAQSKVVAACKSRRDTSGWSLPCRHFDFVLLISRTVGNKCLSFKYSHLWYFVMATQIDEDKYFSCVDFFGQFNFSWDCKMPVGPKWHIQLMATLLPAVFLAGTELTMAFVSHKGHIQYPCYSSRKAGPEGGTHLPSLVEEVDFSHSFNLVLKK